MKNTFQNICANYPFDKSETFAKHPAGVLVRSTLKSKIINALNLDTNKFTVTGSIGQGRWAEVPWLSIFINDITTTATKGYYIVYLFKADMSGFYLSLNQGWTYFDEKYGTTLGKVKIKTTAELLKQELQPISKTFSTLPIDLSAKGPLGKGYELGHICGCYYDINNLPCEETLISNLNELLEKYKDLHHLINQRNSDEFNDFLLLNSDNKFLDDLDSDHKFTIAAQEIITDSLSLLPKPIVDEPQEPPAAVTQNTGSKHWTRNAVTAARALASEDFKCVFNQTHTSFISKTTGKPYMEPHHLIPLSNQGNFYVSLDVEANIVSLCSHCHNCVHYGIDTDKYSILNKLFHDRISRLNACGINITFDELLNLYGVIPLKTP
ncbi:MAG: MrcB family domain-containing protein [Clostridium sp.]